MASCADGISSAKLCSSSSVIECNIPTPRGPASATFSPRALAAIEHAALWLGFACSHNPPNRCPPPRVNPIITTTAHQQCPSVCSHAIISSVHVSSPANLPPYPLPNCPLSHNSPNSSQLQVSQRFVTTDATASHTDTTKIPQSADEHFTINLAPEAFETYNLDPLGLEMDVTRNELTQMYQNMVIIRRLEMASDALYKAKKIRGLYGPVHLLEWFLFF